MDEQKEQTPFQGLKQTSHLTLTGQSLVDSKSDKASNTITFFPKMVMLELVALLLAVGLVVALALILPVGYEEKADTLITPAGVKAEWYFLWIYQLMKLVPVLVGISIPTVLVIAFFLLPWIDHQEGRTIRERARVIAGGFIILALIAALTVWAVLPGGG